MNRTDQHLLDLLRENARAPTAVLARKLGVARSTVQSRLQRLERSGVIDGYTVRTTEAYERRLIRAHVMINVQARHAARTEQALRKMTQVRALYSISGVYDLIAVIAAESTEEMDRLLDEIRTLTGVDATTSSIVLAEKFSR